MTPACYYACPVSDAVRVDRETGAVIIDEKKCIACGRCAEACLLGMITYNPSKKVYLKCDLCEGEPKCVEWCPSNALKYDRRKPVREVGK
jgi:Fe-S-cluster-containing hydrogenase component 2